METETDSDSDGSHISTTPPREPKQPPEAPLLKLLSSYKPKSVTRVRIPSRRNHTSNPKSSLNHKPLKTKTKTKTKIEPSEVNPLPNTFLSPDFSALPGLSVQIRRHSDRNHNVSAPNSMENLPANFCSKSTFFSKSGRTYSIPEPTEKDPSHPSVSIPQQEVGSHGPAETAGKCSVSITPDNSHEDVGGGESTKFERKHPNSIEGNVNPLPVKHPKPVSEGNFVSSREEVCSGDSMKFVSKHPNSIGGNAIPLPLKRPKPVSEGNFVRLNINGYGRKFKNKSGKRYNSYPSRGRRSRWRSKKKSKAQAEAEGLCDEDGLVFEVTQEQQHQRKGSKFSFELIEQAVLDARVEPSAENLAKLVKLTHGYDSFREGQLEAIKQVLMGKSTMLVLPTGAGKSLCYQLPALILPGITLVVSPLVALMVDQLRQLPPMIQGALLCSIQTSEEASETVRRLLEGHVKVLFVSPERFLNADFLSVIGAAPRISLVVVDEAHCLSEWSHNFRTSYLRLRASLLRAKLNVECILAMTATATTKTLKAVMHALEIPSTSLIHVSQIRENLQLSVTLSVNRMKDLMTLMKSSPFMEVRSIIIYCKFQFETDLLSKYLCDNNISAKSYHSGIPAKDRSRTQELFCSNKIRAVVATVAFGMGLDKSDVGAVIHYSLPESLEEYVQEIGRAGRDGKLSYCHLFFDDTTYFKLRSLLYSEGVDEYAVNKFLCQVFSSAMSSPGKICSIVKESASRKFDMKEEVMLTVLTYLELGEVQYLRLLPQLSVTCTLYFHKTSPSLLAGRDVVVAEILKKSEKKQGHYVFDIPTVANNIGITTIDLTNQLQDLKSKGEITYEVKDPAFCYVIAKNPGDFCSLSIHITRWLSEVESCKVWKLDAMFNAVTFAANECKKTDGCSSTLHTRCLQSRILDYFGRDDNSAHNDFPIKMSRSSPFLRADIKVFLQSNSHAKFTPRAVARIMYGIPSPAYPSATWSKTHFWGRYSQIDFPVVMEAAMAELINFAGKDVL